METVPRKHASINEQLRNSVRQARPCPINERVAVVMTRAGVISACIGHNTKGGANAGKRGASICDDCQTGKAIRQGKRRFPLPDGIKLYTLAELERLKATIKAPPRRRGVCHV